MKPAPFDYLAPTSLAEAVSAMEQFGMDAKVLAGGQSLMPVLAMRLSRFEYLVDLNRVPELAFITSDADSVTVGAMTREATVGADPTVARLAPLLTQATKHIGHFQIRNRGTLGGSIAHADPSAEYPAAAMALDATMQVAGPGGTREVAAADFFAGSMMSSLADEEILQSVRFPTWGGDSRFAVREFARRAGDFATAGVAAGLRLNDGVIDKVSIGFFGMGPTPTRAHELEAQLIGQRAADLDLVAVGQQAVVGLEPPGDIHASSAFR
ncbi:MAG: xanthine dehydrogenase family protein subunit, partial [Frankiales bacterium]|nr:xanthine dehydrogenase family protein subunit [Frankiales bacterium]